MDQSFSHWDKDWEGDWGKDDLDKFGDRLFGGEDDPPDLSRYVPVDNNTLHLFLQKCTARHGGNLATGAILLNPIDFTYLHTIQSMHAGTMLVGNSFISVQPNRLFLTMWCEKVPRGSLVIWEVPIEPDEMHRLQHSEGDTPASTWEPPQDPETPPSPVPRT